MINKTSVYHTIYLCKLIAIFIGISLFRFYLRLDECQHENSSAGSEHLIYHYVLCDSGKVMSAMNRSGSRRIFSDLLVYLRLAVSTEYWWCRSGRCWLTIQNERAELARHPRYCDRPRRPRPSERTTRTSLARPIFGNGHMCFTSSNAKILSWRCPTPDRYAVVHWHRCETATGCPLLAAWSSICFFMYRTCHSRRHFASFFFVISVYES